MVRRPEQRGSKTWKGLTAYRKSAHGWTRRSWCLEVYDELAWRRLARYRDRFVALHDSSDVGGMADLAAELIECLDESLSRLSLIEVSEKKKPDSLEARLDRVEAAIDSMHRKPTKGVFTRRKR